MNQRTVLSLVALPINIIVTVRILKEALKAHFMEKCTFQQSAVRCDGLFVILGELYRYEDNIG